PRRQRIYAEFVNIGPKFACSGKSRRNVVTPRVQIGDESNGLAWLDVAKLKFLAEQGRQRCKIHLNGSHDRSLLPMGVMCADLPNSTEPPNIAEGVMRQTSQAAAFSQRQLLKVR